MTQTRIPLLLLTFILCLPMSLIGGPKSQSDVLEAYSHEWEMKRSEEPKWRTAHFDADSVHEYDVLSYDLALSCQLDPAPLDGEASIRVVVRDYQDTLWLNAQGLTIEGVATSEGPRAYTYREDLLGIAGPWVSGDTVTFFISYSAPVVEDNWQTGFHYGWHLAFTFAEPYGARQWFPCFDEPFDKADETRISLEMPEDWHLASNGSLDSVASPAPGRVREFYGNTEPICTYLMSISAAPYARWYDNLPGGGQVRYFAFRQDSMAAAYDWARSPQMISQFQQQFGPYPFQNYGMAEADIFYGWGAMEHQTFTTMGFQLVDSFRTYEGIVAHELAHQWFGDALSPVDFRNIWLNEGFATYGNALWLQEAGDSLDFENFMGAIAEAYFAEDRDIRYSVFDPPGDHLFGATVYYKGAWVLHMLRYQLLGDSLFFEALPTYTSRFLYGTVNTEDFKEVCEEVSGQELDWFFSQWVYQAGFPVLNIELQPGDASIAVVVTQLQENAPSAFRIPITVDVTEEGGVARYTLWFNEREEIQRIYPPGAFWEAELAPFQPLLYQGTGANVPGIAENAPLEISLGQNWPNPFNSSTTFSVTLNRTADVEFSLFNLLGQRILTIAQTTLPPGNRMISFDAPPSLSTGIYFVEAQAGNSHSVRRILLLK
jgi:aminopeptidase N